MKIIIQELLTKLFTDSNHNETWNNSLMSQEAKDCFSLMQEEFERLKASNEEDKQKKLISLFLGGTILTMDTDELKYGYKFGASNIVNTALGDYNSTWLNNMYAVGNYILNNPSIPDSFYTQGRLTSDRIRENNPSPIYDYTKPYFPALAANSSELEQLLKFCEQYKDNLEITEINTDDFVDVQGNQINPQTKTDIMITTTPSLNDSSGEPKFQTKPKDPVPQSTPAAPQNLSMQEKQHLINKIEELCGNTNFWKQKVRRGGGVKIDNGVVPDGVAQIFKLIATNHMCENPDALLKYIAKIANKKHSERFQWLHSLFRGRDNETNNLYKILKDLDKSSSFADVEKRLDSFLENANLNVKKETFPKY